VAMLGAARGGLAVRWAWASREAPPTLHHPTPHCPSPGPSPRLLLHGGSAFVPHTGQIIIYKSHIWDSCGSG
jgi:hypothetical protein